MQVYGGASDASARCPHEALETVLWAALQDQNWRTIMDSDFKEYVREHITEFLPDSYKNTHAFLEIEMCEKGVVRTAIIIPDADFTLGPRIYLDDLAAEVCSGRDIDDALRAIAEARTACDDCTSAEEGVCGGYESVRPTLTTRLCDIQYNENYLLDKPWTPYGPFAVFYRYRQDANDPDSTTPVTNDVLKSWGVSRTQLHRDAFDAERRPHFLPDPDSVTQMYFDHTDSLRD